jgi:bifunctional non-homologous end joining protein LigD
MGLAEYKKKRKFERTPEPAGSEKRAAGKLRFVVQKHHASHLHYDFRLELDGVLKSWAVPKGPSLDPSVKRLAMMVEDHPYDYRTFEGVIPKGNYGAGEVIVWDEGFYEAPGAKNRRESEQALQAGLLKGDLKFVLHGKKLKGEYVLAKMRRTKGGKDNTWLLIKKKDEFARADDVTARGESVKTGRTLEELGGRRAQKISRAAPDVSAAPKAPQPRDVRPMLATLVDHSFDREGWIFEIKWDGFRAVAETGNGKVRLYSRNLLKFNDRFPEIAEELKKIKHTAVLDGEIVAHDENGKPSFQLLQNFHRDRKGTLAYYVFDILHLNGRDLTKLPLTERKRILQGIVTGSGLVRVSEHVEKEGRRFYAAAVKEKLEGIIAKDGQSPYRPGKRTEEWLKVKVIDHQEAVIAGFTRPRGGRKDLGAVVLGVYDQGKLSYIGHTGGGFDTYGLRDLRLKLDKLVTKKSPFEHPPKTNAPVTWVRPELVCEVKFQEWTSDGRMRQPIFLGLRPDKKAADVRRELPEHAETAAQHAEEQSGHGGILIGRRILELTHLDKIYWPKEGYTKRDLIEYYRRMAPLVLPYLKDRPESLHRHPNGIEGESFYQKNVDHQPPDWIQTATIHSESDDKDVRYAVIEDEASLVYFANWGCIEMNPWLSRVGSLERPDWLLLDLDPEGIGFDAVIEAAQEIRTTLEALDIPSYPKTSGATGLHIGIPLGAKYDYEQSKTFAEIVMRMVQRKLPKTTSVERMPKKRQKKVYLDFLQNRKGQTMAAPYSLRPKPGAPVSTPLKWNEVKKGLDPSAFNIKTIEKRADKVGDLWGPVLGKGVNLKKVLERL